MRRIRYGMVGGGPGAFIGAVHRMAAAMDGEAELVAGAFSADPERSRSQGRELGLDPSRVHGSWVDLLASEAERPPAERMEFVSIVTPNHLHYPVADAALAGGFGVVCDKPLTTTVDHAHALCARVRETGLPFAVTYNYSGYPMVKEARARVRAGHVGTVRKVVVEYLQGWLSTRLEGSGHKQATWRLDPDRAGASSALGDIGSHAHHLLRYVTGLRIERMLADLGSLVPGRSLEDDATVLLHLDGGARGLIHVSQVAVGEENGLSLRVYGSRGALTWRQERPDELWVVQADAPPQRVTRGSPGLSDAARNATRLPPGHPEGFVPAFANLYRGFCRALRVREDPESGAAHFETDVPTVEDGARGVEFVHAALRSSASSTWVPGPGRADP